MERVLLSKLNDLISQRRLAIVITIISDGSSYIFDDIEGVSEAFPQLASDVTKFVDKTKSAMIEVDGESYFVSIYRPAPKMVIIGAVHISQALAPMARMSGFDVCIIDPRGFFASKERFPDELLFDNWPDEIFKENPLDPYTAVVTLTHDPKIDDIALIAAMQTKCFYIGALGSRKTHAKRVSRFEENPEVDNNSIDLIEAPVGLDIGSSTPAEIAVAILASVIEHWRKSMKL